MTFEECMFWSLALVTCLSAIAVAVSQNIVRAAVWLLFTLAAVSCLYLLLGADFVGAVQLIVYVGGILILVVFGVMLTNQGPFVNMKTSAGEWVISLIVGLILLGLLLGCIFATNWTDLHETLVVDDAANSRSANDLGLALLGVAQPQTLPDSQTAKLNVLPQKKKTPVAYLFPFEIVSVHLVVVLVGAAYLARAKRRRRAS